MSLRFLRAAAVLSALLLGAPAFAEDAPVKAAEAFVKKNLIVWLNDKVVIEAIKAQNESTPPEFRPTSTSSTSSGVRRSTPAKSR